MKADALKIIADAERRLKQKEADRQLKLMMEFKDDPSVGDAMQYMEKYHEPIPAGHHIFRHIEELKLKDVVKNRDSSEKAAKDAETIAHELNKMLEKLERETDKIFRYYEQNKGKLNTDYIKITCANRLGRFLCGMKSSFRGAKIK